MSGSRASAELLAVRAAVDDALSDLPSGTAVLAGCSGGPDSLALAGALGWVAPRRGLHAHAIVVDHGLQDGSAAVARRAADLCARLGVDARVVPVEVGTVGGPEAAARTARRAALERGAAALGSPVILLGHTRDDQAETVLLRLARGSGARTLAAMAARTGPWRRPLLDLPRSDVHAAARELLEPVGGEPWSDPHNDDPAFARVRVRGLLAAVSAELGPGVSVGLARSAALLRDDADALDALAAEAFARVVADDGSAACDDLAELLTAVRTRVLRLMCVAAGSPADRLDLEHVRQVHALVVAWHGQGPVALPGRVEAARGCGRLCLRPVRSATWSASGA